MPRQKTCLKCGANIPAWIKVDGVDKSLCRRKYCLECSPWGGHNTRKIHISSPKKDGYAKGKHEIVCAECGKSAYVKKGNYCYSCNTKNQIGKANDKKYDIVGGYKCWHCGYGGDRSFAPLLDFHHIDPSLKKFGLTNRKTCGRKWEEVILEMRKCILLCSRCHREVEYGKIPAEVIAKEYEDRWAKIGNIKLEKPSKEVLREELRQNTLYDLGKKYGVTDTAIIKWAKSYDIYVRSKSFCTRNGKDMRYVRNKKIICEIKCLYCEKDFIPKYKEQKYCSPACSVSGTRKVKDPPSIEVLEQELSQNTQSIVAAKYGVSRRTIRRWKGEK